MKKFIEIFCLLLKYKAESLFEKIRRAVWNKGIKLQWNRLWVRRNEFHSSLEMDFDAMLGMNKKQENAYLKDLIRRRQIAHERDLIRTSPAYRATVASRQKLS